MKNKLLKLHNSTTLNTTHTHTYKVVKLPQQYQCNNNSLYLISNPKLHSFLGLPCLYLREM